MRLGFLLFDPHTLNNHLPSNRGSFGPGFNSRPEEKAINDCGVACEPGRPRGMSDGPIVHQSGRCFEVVDPVHARVVIMSLSVALPGMIMIRQVVDFRGNPTDRSGKRTFHRILRSRRYVKAGSIQDPNGLRLATF